MEAPKKPDKKLLVNIVVSFYALVLLTLSWLNLRVVIEQIPADFFLAKIHRDNMNFIDFTKYYLCGKVAFTPDSHEFYSYPHQKKLFDDLINGGEAGNFPPAQAIEFPPYVLPLMYPISRIPFAQAFQLWTVLNCLSIALSVSLLCSLGEWGKTTRGRIVALLIMLAVLCSPPFLRTFMVGQPTGILIGLFSIFIFAYLKKKDVTAGIFLSLISIKPHYAVFMCIPALAQKRFNLLIICALCEAFLLSLAILASDLDGVLGYIHYVIATDTTAPAADHLVSHMVNLRGLLSIFVPSQLLMFFSLGISFLALMFCGWLFYRFKNKINESWLFAVLVISCLFLGPHTHMYDCLLLAIPAALTLNSSPKDKSHLLWTALFALYPIVCVSYLVSTSVLRETYYAFLPYSIFNLTFLAMAAWMTLKQSKSPDCAIIVIESKDGDTKE